MRLIKVTVHKSDDDGLLFKRPLWVVVCGEQREKLALKEIYEAYRQRFDLEHFFRFGKNILLMDKFQTPEVNHEEAWWQMVILAYAQLYLSKELSVKTPNPWEKYAPQFKTEYTEHTPSQVQKDFGRIIRAFGTFANPPKPRNKCKGREKGAEQIRRPKQPIITKSKKNILKDVA